MKYFSIKTMVLGFALMFCLNTFAQKDFQGKAIYQSKTTIDMDSWGDQQMSPERKKMIKERMKNMLEKTCILTFNKTESSYKEDEQLDAPSASSGRGRVGGMMSSFSAGTQYKNIKDGTFLQDQEFFGKQFLIKDELQKLEWKITGDTKQIGKYTCMKATAMKKVDEMDWTNMRRRNRGGDKEAEKKTDSTIATASKDPMDEIETPKEVGVTAWYTMQIPVNNGPGEFWGLPGLILEVNSGKTTILCSQIILNPTEKEEIKKPSKGKEVTKEEYAVTVKNKMKEMREMRGGRNRGSRRGGF